jgi:nucleoside-diphosphate-sugar epimerase
VHVFVTGATGFIGSAIVRELIDSGHQVVGLARSDRSAAALAAAGAGVHRGSLQDPGSLRTGAAESDGVIHTAFNHFADPTQMAAAGRADLGAVETLGGALEGSGRSLVVTTVTIVVAPGRLATEDDPSEPGSLAEFRVASEAATLSFAGRGVRSSVMRLPPSVHGEGDHIFVPLLIDIARRTGVSAYIGDGANRWPAVHRLDAARLYRLAVEAAPPSTTLHAVAEEGVPTRDIAEVIGRQLGLPVRALSPTEAGDHFGGWLAAIFGADIPASSALTRERMAWEPAHSALIADLEQGHYFARAHPDDARAGS